MGSGLIAIKNRIKSVTSTKKITRAMGLISTSKFQKIKNKQKNSTVYIDAFKKVLGSMLNSEDFIKEGNIYKDGNKSDNKLYVIITSDLGFCGDFNTTVLNTALEKVNEDKEHSKLIILGEKGQIMLKKFKYDIVAKYRDIPDFPTINDVETLASQIIKMYKNNEVGQVYFVYTLFKSTLNKKAKVEKLLPLCELTQDKDESSEFIFEISDFEKIVNLYIRSSIYNYTVNSKASEHSTRMMSMDGATKNANDLLNDLNVKYNKERQSMITSEINEIVSGAEALK